MRSTTIYREVGTVTETCEYGCDHLQARGAPGFNREGDSAENFPATRDMFGSRLVI